MSIAGIHPGLGLAKVKGFQEIMKDIQQPELASEYCYRLLEYIKAFDDRLDETEEVAMQLVSFGQSIQFSVQEIGFYDPKLISFGGELPDGSPVQLIQNVNQISFLLLAVKRKNPDKPKPQIGFCHSKDQTMIEEDSNCDQSAATKE